MEIKNQIRWKQGDYVTLGKAVSNFNKKVQALKDEEVQSLPNEVSYKDLKNSIKTRRELNNTINSLKRFQKAGAEDVVMLPSGQEITKWEKNEIAIEKRVAIRNLNKELAYLNIPNKEGFTRVQMGSEVERQIKRTIQSLNNIQNRKGEQFQRVRERLKYYGSSDYLYRKNYIYKENYLKMFEEFENYSGYEKFRKKLASMSPDEFANFMNNNPEIDSTLNDIKYMYDLASGNLGTSGNTSQQEMFDYLLEKTN